MTWREKVEEDTLFRVKNAEKDFDVNLLGAIGYPTLNHYTSLTSQSFPVWDEEARLFLLLDGGQFQRRHGAGRMLCSATGTRFTARRTCRRGARLPIKTAYMPWWRPAFPCPSGFLSPSSAVSSLSNLPDEVVRMDLQQEIFASAFRFFGTAGHGSMSRKRS